ncbi:pilus assembly protein CpaC [Sphingomonas vulcanisoli]|uniref:Pilus assembly protein CpaC n=1 Tax=Sphingomonas vulcanisoli TaxID=1658060 RepID=A0ABX0TN96_9SPHN|nr:type II and III secretion system protein family protein [Sphingomonas vulcanisoli]NIJ06997.1 pilus assembly protein CpaC [Sphingomonas vulcanisoli]
MRVTINRGVLLAAAMAMPAPADAAPADKADAVAIGAADAATVLVPSDSANPTHAELPARAIALSIGTGQLIRLPRPISGMFIADDKIADVQVKSTTQVYLFAKAAGETSVFATDKSGAVVWSATVRVGNNIAGVGSILRAAMPDNDVTATPIGANVVLLTGTVLGPKDAEEAQTLAEAYLGKDATVLNHLKVATPQQVSLHVKIAEVSRSVARDIGVNITNRGHGNPIFSIGQGSPGTISTNANNTVDPASGATPGSTIYSFAQGALGTTLGLAGHAFGADILSTLNLAEQSGLVTTLAEPNLVAMSGETASFLAGGEIPIPQSQGLGAVSVQYKEYGVSLSFTPVVMSSGRISIRVRPEVSELSDAGSVKLNGFTIPSLTTRRVETTVELGSGQSFAIGGLLQNTHNNSLDKAPMLGDLPVIGALFRSNSFRKQETELVVVVTPYIVKPVDAARIALPTDGYRSPTTADRVLLGKMSDAAPPPPVPVAVPSPGLQ